MVNSVLKYTLKINLKLLSKFRLQDLFYLKTSGKYWKIRSLKRGLLGYEIKRLNKYENGISLRLKTLGSYFGSGIKYDISSEDVVVDIGANIGEFSLLCLEKGARVLSVEPDENISYCTNKNICSFPNSIGLEKSAISDKNGTVKFFRAPSNADSSIFEPERYDDVIKINTITLDSLYQKYNLNKIALIKCDAEGAEPEVLASAVKTLANTKMVSFNCGPERLGEDTVEEVSEILKNHNFEITLIDGYRPKTIVFGVNKKFSEN